MWPCFSHSKHVKVLLMLSTFFEGLENFLSLDRLRFPKLLHHQAQILYIFIITRALFMIFLCGTNLECNPFLFFLLCIFCMRLLNQLMILCKQFFEKSFHRHRYQVLRFLDHYDFRFPSSYKSIEDLGV